MPLGFGGPLLPKRRSDGEGIGFDVCYLCLCAMKSCL